MYFGNIQTVQLLASNSGATISAGNALAKNGTSIGVPGEAQVMSVTLNKPFSVIVPLGLIDGSSPIAVLSNNYYTKTISIASGQNYGVIGINWNALRIVLTSDVTAFGSMQVGMPQ